MGDLDLSRAHVAAFLAVAAVYWTYVQSRPDHHKPPFPPSPQSDPLIGHLRVLPTSNEHVVYRRWAEELKSDVISLRVPGQTLIVLNSAQATLDLFEKRSKQYSGRPFIPMVMDPTLVDWSRHIAFLQYGERWKHQRQLMHVSFRKGAVHKYWPTQTKYAREAARRIMEQPKDFVTALRRMSGGVILSVVYGYEVTTPDDQMIKAIERSADHLGRAVLPSNFLVNVMPWLNYFPSWLPGMGWRNVVQEWRKELKHTVEVPYEFTVQQMATGTAPPSALSDMLKDAQSQSEKLTPEAKDHIMWTAGSVFTAAVDSSLSTLQVFILAMTLHQHVQAKLQDEIDQITGGKRLPELSDMENMPYARCVILEVLRWQPVTPLGLPHTCEQDDVYGGYFIPKGSIVFSNIWAIHRDESRYDNPGSFIPERFLDPSTPEPVSFGFGRRQCPGMQFAHATLFINIVTILATCNIQPICDEEGKPVLPVVEMVQNMLVTWVARNKVGYNLLSNRDSHHQDELSADDCIDESSAVEVRRKIDRNLLPLMMILYGVQYLDKVTLGRAAVLGFIEDNNLSASQYNWLGSIIYLGYLIFAFPQNVALQRAPIGKWISLNVFIWGVAMMLQSTRLPFTGLLACRFVLGMCEGSITSGFLMVTSMFYTKSEQSSRVGYWFLMNGTAQIISSLMGYASLYFQSKILAPWQWFTLINAVLTFATAIAFYLYFPDSISTAQFLTEQEKKIAEARVREHETDVENKDWKQEQFIEALYDPKTWLFASFSLFNNIPTSIGIQHSLIVESLGFTRPQTTLLGTLDGVIEIITIYTGVKLVEYFGNARAYVGSVYMVSDVLAAILVTTLPWSNKVGLLISIYLTDIGTTGYVLGLAWVTSSTAGRTKRATTQAIMLSAFCIGNLIGPHMWQEKYKPRNRVPWFIIGTCYSCCIVLLLVIRRKLEKENRRRDELAETEAETEDSESTSTDLTDIQNLKFRYVL